jgi:hypothetical protein
LPLIALSAISGEPSDGAADHGRFQDQRRLGDVVRADAGEVVVGQAFYPKCAADQKRAVLHVVVGRSGRLRAEQEGSDERVAACFYDKKLLLDLYLKDGEHRVALYMNDFNRKGRSQKSRKCSTGATMRCWCRGRCPDFGKEVRRLTISGTSKSA